MRGSINTAARALLVAVVVGSVLAIGTLHVPVLVIVSLTATVSAALSILGGGKVGTSPFVWVVLGLLAFTLLQAVPLPFGLLRRLAPDNADIWQGAKLLIRGAPDAAAPLSLDPGATLVEALRLWTYFCVLVAAAAATAKHGAGWGALVLASSALLLTLITVGHGVSDATQVFGIYTPRLGGKGFRVAPLINPNNLAGYLSLGTAAGLSLLATDEPPIPRWITALALTPVVGMGVLTGSRAGTMALGVAIVFGVWLLRPRAGDAREKRALFAQFAKAAALVLAVAVMFAVVAAGPRLWHLLMDDNFAKLNLAKASLPLIAQHAWLGVGRGAFESVFPALHAAPDNQIYSHPENFLLQWSSEWGIPVTLAALIGVAVCAKRGGFTLGSSSARRGLLAGVCALALQNLFDLGFEVPGVMIAVMAAVGFSARKADSSQERLGRRRSSRRQLTAFALVLAGVALCLVAYRGGARTLLIDRDQVRETIPDDVHQPAQLDAFKQTVKAAVMRHPAEPYFPRLAALVAWRAGENPLPWIDRALERGLSAGRTHYLLGAFLASIGKKQQALLELRMAASLDPAMTRHIASVCLKLTQDPQELSRAIPEGPDGAQLLLSLAGQLPKESETLAMNLIELAIAREPTDPKPRLGLVRRLLMSLSSGTAACAEAAQATCIERARAQLAFLEHKQPRPPDLVIWKARLQIATRNPAEAVRVLEEACPRLEERMSCLKTWLEAVTALRDGAALTRVARAIREEGCGAEKACAALLWSAGETAVALGNPELALAQFEQAASLDNSSARWRSVARQAQRNGYGARALRAMDRAISLSPDDNSMVKERNAMRQEVLHAIP